MAAYLLCPRCEGDYIVRARIKITDAIVFVCPECDAYWKDPADISAAQFFDFSKDIAKNNWNDVENLGPLVAK